MLNFDEPRFVRIMSGAVGLAAPLRDKIGELIDAGATDLHFVGAGGAGIQMLPAYSLLSNKSTLPVFLDQPAELVLSNSVNLRSSSIVVIPSVSGTTVESLEALRFARGLGATVITLTGYDDSPLAQEADATFTNFAADDTSSESFYIQSYLVALAVLDKRGEIDNYDEIVQQFELLPSQLVEVKRSFEARAEEVAELIQDETYHVITGSGLAWAEAWNYGMCILEEMQWVRTRPVHASDFFHGTLELVTKDVSVILFKGEDATRPLADRVEAFVPRVSSKLLVFDTAEYDLPGTSSEVRALLSPIVLAAIMERLSAHLEVVRRHPLVVRRYYRKIAY